MFTGQDGKRAGYARILAAANDGSQHEEEARKFGKVVVCGCVMSRTLASWLGDRVNIYPVKGYSITVNVTEKAGQQAAPRGQLARRQGQDPHELSRQHPLPCCGNLRVQGLQPGYPRLADRALDRMVPSGLGRRFRKSVATIGPK